MNHETIYRNVESIGFGRIVQSAMGKPLPNWIRFDLELALAENTILFTSGPKVLGFLAQLDTLGQKLSAEAQRMFCELKDREGEIT